MAASVSDKLKIKPGYTLLVLNAPPGFKKGLGGLPRGVNISKSAKVFDQVHWFVTDRAQLEKQAGRVIKKLKPGVLLWIYYPKQSSGIQTDLSRDKGWDCLRKEKDKLSWISLISFNDTWSVFGVRAQFGADKKKDSAPENEREIFKWVNPKTREISPPDDLSLALKKNRREAAFFDALSFTNKKEYIEWVVTAKREETRKERIRGTIERLGKHWKNPGNR